MILVTIFISGLKISSIFVKDSIAYTLCKTVG
jgi:hypothetical protein